MEKVDMPVHWYEWMLQVTAYEELINELVETKWVLRFADAKVEQCFFPEALPLIFET